MVKETLNFLEIKKILGVPPLRGVGLLSGSAKASVPLCHDGPAGRGQAVLHSRAPLQSA
jgi:hypothetical protein